MTSKHTTGPWHVETSGYGCRFIRAADGKTVSPILSAADAHMIASAPDMYEALKRMVAHYDRMRFARPGYATGTELPAIVEKARAALSKAEGAP